MATAPPKPECHPKHRKEGQTRVTSAARALWNPRCEMQHLEPVRTMRCQSVPRETHKGQTLNQTPNPANAKLTRAKQDGSSKCHVCPTATVRATRCLVQHCLVSKCGCRKVTSYNNHERNPSRARYVHGKQQWQWQTSEASRRGSQWQRHDSRKQDTEELHRGTYLNVFIQAE